MGLKERVCPRGTAETSSPQAGPARKTKWGKPSIPSLFFATLQLYQKMYHSISLMEREWRGREEFRNDEVLSQGKKEQPFLMHPNHFWNLFKMQVHKPHPQKFSSNQFWDTAHKFVFLTFTSLTNPEALTLKQHKLPHHLFQIFFLFERRLNKTMEVKYVITELLYLVLLLVHWIVMLTFWSTKWFFFFWRKFSCLYLFQKMSKSSIPYTKCFMTT